MSTNLREAFAWYTPAQAAARTQRSVARVLAAIQAGDLRAKRPGVRNLKIRADWLDAWMDSEPDA